MFKKLFALILIGTLAAGLSACGSDYGRMGDDIETLSKDEAEETLSAYLTKVETRQGNPEIDLSGEADAASEVPPIGTYPLSVDGQGEIDVEIISSTEKAGEGSDGWLNEAADEFNAREENIGGKTVSVSVRPVASGLALDYLTSQEYLPDAFSPANELWGEMAEAAGVAIEKVEDRLCGNTAGILMSRKMYEKFTAQYGEVNLANVLQSQGDGFATLAYTNPYASSTGLNMLTAMLHEFDPANPLSEQAVSKLRAFQASAPPVAFTTKQMRESAESGAISVMIMEYQAYITSETLKDYVFTPLGVRHDSPLYVFGATSEEKREALRLFTDFVKSEAAQEQAKEYGFNYEEQYTSTPPNLDGAGLIEAQKIWKENKEGGKPIIAVFVADTSGSMEGTPLAMLQASLLNSQKYIGENSYIGLVSYASDVTIELPIGKFEGEQRGRFAGAVKSFSAAGGTATYDAVLVAISMIKDAEKETPDARARIFVLSDGETNEGYALSKIAPLVKAYGIPIHTIGYNQAIPELEDLSRINEASSTKASEADIVYSIKNIFNAQM